MSADVPAMIEPVAPAPAAETPAPAPEPAPAARPTILADVPAKKTEEPAAAEPEPPPEPPADEKLADEAAEPAKPEPIAYTDFTFPEGQTADPEIVKGASELFSAAGLSQEHAQGLVDYANNVLLPRWTEQKLAHDVETLNGQIARWQEEFEASPIGGNRKETTLGEARTAITHFGGTPEQQELVYQLGAGSGVFNHPAVIGTLANSGRFAQEVMRLTQTSSPADALKHLREPKAPPTPLPPRANPGGNPAQRRYRK